MVYFNLNNKKRNRLEKSKESKHVLENWNIFTRKYYFILSNNKSRYYKYYSQQI